ncbi:MAG: hypothetical protein ABEJ58_01860 [Halodesulfurarchaeum sp.]
MGGNETWQCANCHTLVEKDGVDRCPTCGHVFFYPVPESVTDSDGDGVVRVENVDLEAAFDHLRSLRKSNRRSKRP